VTVSKLLAILAMLNSWDWDLTVVDKDGNPIRGATIVETDEGLKVKLT